jgi:hypothetical protein
MLAGIVRVFDATRDPDAIPPIPEREVTINHVPVKLDAAQYSRLRELVGEETRRRLEDMDLSDPSEATVRALQRQYRYAMETGRRRWLAENRDRLSTDE